MSISRFIAATALAMVVISGTSDAAVLTGTWDNTSFGSSGPLTLDLTLTEDTFDASLSVEGFAFGQPEPPGGRPPVEFSGAIGIDGVADIDVPDHPVFGDVLGTFDSNTGSLNVAMSDIPDPSIFSGDVTGTLGLSGGSGSYRVWFVDPDTISGEPVKRQHFADGTFTLVPEPVSLALLGMGAAFAPRRRS